MSTVASPTLVEKPSSNSSESLVIGTADLIDAQRAGVNIFTGPCTPDSTNVVNSGKMNLTVDTQAKLANNHNHNNKHLTEANQAGQAVVTPDPPRRLPPRDPAESGTVETKSAPNAGLVNGGDSTSNVVESNPMTPTASSSKGMAPPKQNNSEASKDVKSSNSRRGRVISLDRGQEVSDLEGDAGPATDDERRHTANFTRSKNSAPQNDDSSVGSSDGDGSYFAKHMPSPKSGRRFSYSSNNSAPARTNFFLSSVSRESDASLSFSSDDDLPHSEPAASPSAPNKTIADIQAVADMQLYPQRITRMHSVSSLVSSGSSDILRRNSSRDGAGIDQSGMGRDNALSSESSCDPSVSAELKTVTSGSRFPGTSQNDKPSGRRSPVLGRNLASNPYMGYYGPGPGFPGTPQMGSSQPSPPTILPGYSAPPGMLQPQPQAMTSEQLAAWMAAGNFAAQQGAANYGATNEAHRQEAFPFAYSEDDDKKVAPVAQLAGGASHPHGGPLPGQGLYNDAFQNNDSSNHDNDQGDSFGGNHSFRQTNAGPLHASSGAGGGGVDGANAIDDGLEDGNFKVYWRRWVMLFYMSILNLLSDWTCYSVAPIAMLTQEAFGEVDPEQLVVIFLGANALATACEPIILARLGLRRTVILGSLFLMGGSIIKSGGLPPIIDSTLQKGHDGWKLSLGFFLVGLSQPLYQCTPALLSASWFPERERTMATGVALNANQLGIGCAFIFGTLLVGDSDDIPSYFGLLSIISTLMFMGTLIQFDDAPPTPPSSSAKVMRGSIEYRLPSMTSIFRTVKNFGAPTQVANHSGKNLSSRHGTKENSERSISKTATPSADTSRKVTRQNSSSSSKRGSDSPHAVRRDSGSRRSSRSSSSRKSGSKNGGARRRTSSSSRQQTANTESGFRPAAPGKAAAPSPAEWGDSQTQKKAMRSKSQTSFAPAPSPMMPGRVRPSAQSEPQGDDSPLFDGPDFPDNGHQDGLQHPVQPAVQAPPYGHPQMPYTQPPFTGYPPPQYQYPGYWDPRFQQQPPPPPYYQQQPYQQQPYPQQPYPQQPYQQQPYYYPPPQDPYYYAYPNASPTRIQYEQPQSVLPYAGPVDDGAEPVVTITPHHLDIDIRDDQIILSTRACLSRPGFIHALVSFTVSGIVINTLSTFMDYLVRLNGAGREYVGIVGGSFQIVIMISSLIIGKQTDRTRAYYSVTIAMLVLGAFGLAECGVSLDADRGSDLRWSLIIVAALVGPLQPVSTELGVDVAYPLSENTVLVIQQLFSNLLSALFIPFFKSLKDIGREVTGDPGMEERPEYTFSFYLLIVLHAAATVFFATFNGRYIRYEHELEREEKEQRKQKSPTAFYPVSGGLHYSQSESYDEGDGERQPLVS